MDTFSRTHTYLRISLTERCNLRCVYCMPEAGVPLTPPRELLTTAEIVLLARLFVAHGVTKIRLTGGEPTVRGDFVSLVQRLGGLMGQSNTHTSKNRLESSSGKNTLQELCVTTNGIALHRKLDALRAAGLTGVNLSLDTLDPWQFQIMTRRKGLDAVLRSMNRILDMNNETASKIKLKINCVVINGVNDSEILSFVDLARDRNLEVRFIEYMPFSGNKWDRAKLLPYAAMVDRIRTVYPTFSKLPATDASDTGKTWQVPGHAGRVGFVTSMTQHFCASCSRLRLTAEGNLKVCLFGDAEVSLRDALREAANGGEPVGEDALLRMEALAAEEAAAADVRVNNSDIRMLLDAGIPTAHGEKLLSIIGAAVKRKKARHAGMDALKGMKNRPMVLIGGGVRWEPPVGGGMLQPALFPPSTHLFARAMSSASRGASQDEPTSQSISQTTSQSTLTHVSSSGTAHMVSIADKPPTHRTATAVCVVVFSNSTAASLVRANALKKGDVLATARIAGIMGAKRTPDLVPLCHPVAVTCVRVDVEVWGGDSQSTSPSTSSAVSTSSGDYFSDGDTSNGQVRISATVECDGKTGVEMEALTAASTAALTVYDMCKAVDRGMRIEGLRVVRKEGGRSDWAV